MELEPAIRRLLEQAEEAGGISVVDIPVESRVIADAWAAGLIAPTDVGEFEFVVTDAGRRALQTSVVH